MRLDQDQLRQFDEQGYLFLPQVFAAAEVRALDTRPSCGRLLDLLAGRASPALTPS